MAVALEMDGDAGGRTRPWSRQVGRAVCRLKLTNLRRGISSRGSLVYFKESTADGLLSHR